MIKINACLTINELADESGIEPRDLGKSMLALPTQRGEISKGLCKFTPVTHLIISRQLQRTTCLPIVGMHCLLSTSVFRTPFKTSSGGS